MREKTTLNPYALSRIMQDKKKEKRKKKSPTAPSRSRLRERWFLTLLFHPVVTTIFFSLKVKVKSFGAETGSAFFTLLFIPSSQTFFFFLTQR